MIRLNRSFLLLVLFVFAAFAQNVTDTVSSTESVPVDEEVTLPLDDGDTAWMLISTALVFLMTPGLAMFYGGLVSNRAVINTHLMSWSAISVIGLHWVLFGYSFSFGSGTAGYGNFDFIALRNVGEEPNGDYAPTIPHYLFMVYQMTFAIITGALISGAVVERMRFSSYLIFLVAWTTIVYDLVAHWVWAAWTSDEGEIQFGWIRKLGALDFAGGTVVHITSGFSALAASIVVGKRKDFTADHVHQPHNIPMIMTGAALLWFGWFGFNGGSALASNGLAAVAFTNTQICAFVSMGTWNFWEAITARMATGMGSATGAVVGLVVITPAAGFVEPILAIPIGIIGTSCCFAALTVKKKIYIADDTLDVFCCHGVGGFTGALLTGFFASKEVNEFGADGVFYGNPILLAYQLAAVLVVAAVSFGFTAIILLALRFTLGLRSEDENAGIDKLAHGETAYQFQVDQKNQQNGNKEEEKNDIEMGERTEKSKGKVDRTISSFFFPDKDKRSKKKPKEAAENS